MSTASPKLHERHVDTFSAQCVIRDQQMGSVEREAFCNSRCDSKKNSIARTIPFIQGKFVFPEFLRKCTAQNHQVLVSLANDILP